MAKDIVLDKITDKLVEGFEETGEWDSVNLEEICLKVEWKDDIDCWMPYHETPVARNQDLDEGYLTFEVGSGKT